MLSLFGLLARFKWLRGSWLDPFGYFPERKLERKILSDFEDLVDQLASELTLDNYQTAVELAEQPNQIRGYGHVKADNLSQVEFKRDLLLRQFRGELLPLATEIVVQKEFA